MTEQLPQREPLDVDSERLRRITDVVAKNRFMRRLDENSGEDTLPDFTGLDYDRSKEDYNAVLTGLPPGSTKEDVEATLRQVDRRIEEGGGLDAYLAAETENRMAKEASRQEQRQTEMADRVIAPPPEEEALPSSNPDQETRKGFGRSILRRFTGR